MSVSTVAMMTPAMITTPIDVLVREAGLRPIAIGMVPATKAYIVEPPDILGTDRLK